MRILATYDITVDSRRSRLAALLQSVGNRVQKSVFVLSLDQETLSAARARAAGIINRDEDSLYFFTQCAPCWEALDCIGQADPPRDVLYWAAL